MLEHPFIDCLCPILPQRRAVQEQEGLVKALGMGCVSPGWSWWPRPFLMPCLCKHQWQLLLTAVLPGCWEDSEICGSESPVFLQLNSPLTTADFVPGWSCILKHVGSEWSLLSGWGMLGWLVVRNSPTPHAVSTHPLYPSTVLTRKVHRPHKQSPDFPEPSFCLARPSNQPTGFIFCGDGSQG